MRVAAVELDEVDVPLGECLRVCVQVAQTARVAGARVVTVVPVDAQLQTLGVNLRAESTGEG